MTKDKEKGIVTVATEREEKGWGDSYQGDGGYCQGNRRGSVIFCHGNRGREMAFLLVTHISCHDNKESRDPCSKAADIIGGDRIIAASAKLAQKFTNPGTNPPPLHPSARWYEKYMMLLLIHVSFHSYLTPPNKPTMSESTLPWQNLQNYSPGK